MKIINRRQHEKLIIVETAIHRVSHLRRFIASLTFGDSSRLSP
ncbi:hypothetical protein [Nostoc sp. DSM 114167]